MKVFFVNLTIAHSVLVCITSTFCFFIQVSSALGSTLTANLTKASCSKVKCDCIPDRVLCGKDGQLDLTDWFEGEEGPKGVGEFQCSDTQSDSGIKRNCVFTGTLILV